MAAAHPDLDTELGLRDRRDELRNVDDPPDPDHDRRRRRTRLARGRLPAAAPALAPVGGAEHAQPRRHLRRAEQRRVDRPRPGRRRRARRRPPAAAAAPREPHGPRARGRQVPADGRLRHPVRRAHRRRLACAPRRAPRRGHRGDARGVLQLQRRHARHVDGRRPHLGRGRRRQRQRRRRRSVDHGHAVGWRQGADPGRRALPAGRQLRHRHQPRRRLRRRGRASTSRRRRR